jgi:diacylglycerol kinase family enzyme
MSYYYVLFNSLSCNGKGENNAKRLNSFKFDGELVYLDIKTIKNYSDFFDTLSPDDSIIICGGDGTLNKFINDTNSLEIKNKILYYACGTGNDFLRDIGVPHGNRPVEINKYLKNLPYVTVKGNTYRFLNNVGFGIDGYCSKVGDEMRAAHKENINYAAIAIKGLLGGFKPVNAEITVDGKKEYFKKVWLAPTMKGRFYGGGIMPTPKQDRLDPNETLSVMLFDGKGKLKTLAKFPAIFQGEHLKYTNVHIFTGNDITVKFDRPCPLQIDGECILDVTEYHVQSASLVKNKNKEKVFA